MFLTENANNTENSAAEQQTAAGVFLPFKPLKPSADSLPPFPIDFVREDEADSAVLFPGGKMIFHKKISSFHAESGLILEYN